MNWIEEQKGLALRQQVINGVLFVDVVDMQTKEPVTLLFKFENGVLKLNENAHTEMHPRAGAQELGLRFQHNGAIKIDILPL